jgi:hypothetical protein
MENKTEHTKALPQGSSRGLGHMIAMRPKQGAQKRQKHISQDARLFRHLRLLENRQSEEELSEEVAMTPIFTMPVLKHTESLSTNGLPAAFSQYGLLGGLTKVLENDVEDQASSKSKAISDPRLFFNITTPSSTFICGSQGSGKSHTLSCLLENCLSHSDASELPRPLSGIVFHYDTFISDDGGSPCEAAFLASNPNIKVSVLCAPTNIRTIQACRQ